MKLRAVVAGIALAAATVSTAPAVASADPEFPRNGIIPPGFYHITQHPSNIIGTPLNDCTLRIYAHDPWVQLECGNTIRSGYQHPVGPDETYVTFHANPLGLALRDIDPRQGHWIGTVNLSGTPLAAPYPLAGINLQRR